VAVAVGLASEGKAVNRYSSISRHRTFAPPSLGVSQGKPKLHKIRPFPFSVSPSTDLLTARGVAHLVVHGTSGSTSHETIPRVRLESSGGVLSTADMVVQRRDGPRRLRDHDHDDDVPFPK